MDDDRQDIIIYNTADGRASVSLYAKDGMVWMNQNQLAKLFDTSVPNISMHISNILKDKELDEKSVVKDYLTTAADGKDYHVTFYSLEMVLAIGFRVRSKRGTQFRIWANHHLKEYMVKGFVMDDERLKNPDGRPDYFDELLERIREIRASEKRFYQKVRDKGTSVTYLHFYGSQQIYANLWPYFLIYRLKVYLAVVSYSLSLLHDWWLCSPLPD